MRVRHRPTPWGTSRARCVEHEDMRVRHRPTPWGTSRARCVEHEDMRVRHRPTPWGTSRARCVEHEKGGLRGLFACAHLLFLLPAAVGADPRGRGRWASPCRPALQAGPAPHYEPPRLRRHPHRRLFAPSHRYGGTDGGRGESGIRRCGSRSEDVGWVGIRRRGDIGPPLAVNHVHALKHTPLYTPCRYLRHDSHPCSSAWSARARATPTAPP